MRITLSVALLMACGGEPHHGTAVGNPGNLDVSVGEIPFEISLDLADVHAADLVLLGCDGEAAVVAVQAVLDGLGPSDVDIIVPGGSWCGALLTLDPAVDGQVVLGGVTSRGTDFTVSLNPGSIPLQDAFLVDGTELLLVLRLGDILDASDLESRGVTVDIPADDPSAIGWAGALGERAELYEDQDGDGVFGDADTFVAGFASDTGISGDAVALQDSQAGCGCQSGAGWAGLWLLALPLAFRRRDSPRRRQ